MAMIETPYSELPTGVAELLALAEGQSVYLLYAHMNAPPLVSLDQRVTCGQALGEVGNTPKGWSSDPHLHLEVRAGPPGVTFESLDFYDTGASVEEMDNYRRWRMGGEFPMLDPMVLLEMDESLARFAIPKEFSPLFVTTTSSSAPVTVAGPLTGFYGEDIAFNRVIGRVL
jgi:murein DD-endopeptidase MepM/ murein hydrolase activator NlpD